MDAHRADDIRHANQRLVLAVARTYQGRGLPLDDLVDAGNVGLLHAAAHFDVRGGTSFSGYAGPFIGQSIQHALVRSSA